MIDTCRIPGEWEPHEACWLAFPYLADEWEDLGAAQAGIAGLVRAIAAAGERVELLVHDLYVEATARAAVGPSERVRYWRASYGDSWTRDTAPIFGRRQDGSLVANSFEFDGWGGKYDMPGDRDVADNIAALSGVQARRAGFILEGGAIESDGAGALLLSDCVVMRNPGWTRDTAEAALARVFDVAHFIWIDGLLPNDHTDGHIDTIARFVAPGRVVCTAPGEVGDPLRDAHAEVLASLRSATDAAGRALELVTLPSPGDIGAGDTVAPASYCNYYVANDAVLVPAYGVPQDERARAALDDAFPDRDAVLVDARAIITGGGALHCVTQQQPVQNKS